jgi:hypothetical protein
MSSKIGLETNSWRSGTLRPYESIGSIGAKYCYLNKVKPIEFAKLIRGFILENNSGIFHEYTLDNPRLDIKSLAKFLNEPLSIVDKLSFQGFNQLPHLTKETGFSLDGRHNLTYCPKCLSEGYHSPFHQINWISKCFIHGEALVQISSLNRPISKLGEDTRLIDDLYDIWFSNDDVWGAAKASYWDMHDHKEVITQANKIIHVLTSTEAILRDQNGHSQILIGQNPIAKLLLQTMTNNSCLNNPIKNIHTHEDMNVKSVIEYQCTPEEAGNILRMAEDNLYLLMHSRQAICEANDESTSWRKLLINFKDNLMRGHSACLREYKKSFEKIERIRIRHNSYVHPPYDMQRFRRVPCARIVTLNLLQIPLDFEYESLLTARSISDIHFKKSGIDRISELKNVGLIDEWNGDIVSDSHKIMKRYTPGNIHRTHFETESRRVSVYVPLNVLADIIDEILLAIAYSWIWGLYITETSEKILEESGVVPEKFLRSKFKELFPAIILQQSVNGLNLTIGSMVSYKQPNLTLTKPDRLQHFTNVKNKSKELAQMFDWELAERLRSADLENRYRGYIATNGRNCH